MTTLSTSWKKLNSYTVNDANFKGEFSLFAKISETDIPGNRTKVAYDWDFTLTYGWQSSYDSQDYVSGAGWNEATLRSYSSSGTLRSGSEWIKHADDGRGSGTCYGRTRMGGMGFDTDWVSGSFDLPTIARASKPTINSETTSNNTFVLGDTITVYTNRKFSAAKHTVKFIYPTFVNGATVQNEVLLGTEKGVDTYITYDTSQVSQQMMSSYPNLATIQGTIQCMTYNGSGSQIGSTETISWSASIPDDIRPTITLPSDVIAEETAANGGLKGKSVADKTVVRYISKKKVKATITGMYGATISRAYVTDGTSSWNMTLSSGSYTVTFDNIQSGTLTVVAVDSRGKETRAAISGLTYIPYEKPTLRQAAFVRSNASTGENSKLLAAGTVYRAQVIGNVNPNVITVKYVKGSDAEQTVAMSGITYSSSSWSTNDNVNIGTLNPREQYTGTVTVTDSFNQTVSFDIILSSVQNSLWVGKKTVRVHDYLIADQDVWLNDGEVKLSEWGNLRNRINDTTIYNYSWTGSWSNSNSASRTVEITGKGIVFINVYVRNSGTDDTGQCDATIYLWNTSNANQGLLASSANRVSSSSSHQISANAATQYYYDGSSNNRRLRCNVSCSKNGTNSWRIQAVAIGCTLAVL